MLRKVWILCTIIIFSATQLKAEEYVFDYNENCNKAYHLFLSLKFDEGNYYLAQEFKANPNNLMATYIADYEDYILFMVNCSKLDYNQRKDHFDLRWKLLDKGSSKSPWTRYCKAGLLLHWTMSYLRFGENFKAATSFHKSYALLKDNERLFPDFEYNMVFSGIEEAVVGGLPGSYKWLASLFGMTGNIRKGVQKLNTFLMSHNDNQPLRSESFIYYLYIKFYLLAQYKEVYGVLCSKQFHTEDNLLNAYIKAYMAMDYNKSDELINAVNDAKKDKNFNKYPFFNYLLGVALLTKIDSSCNYYLLDYAKNAKSDFHVKDSWQKMSYYYYLDGEKEKAEQCRKLINKAGGAQLDADKQAVKFAENGVYPNKSLLKARLLVEGGYYLRAYNVLKEIDISTFANTADKVEYYYRLGRIYEESEEYDKALAFYQSAYVLGKERHEQYAARAALHKGRIYEITGKKGNALSGYKDALDLPSHDFQNSIDQQAKAGINRLE